MRMLKTSDESRGWSGVTTAPPPQKKKKKLRRYAYNLHPSTSLLHYPYSNNNDNDNNNSKNKKKEIYLLE
jgi:hypothetical protein